MELDHVQHPGAREHNLRGIDVTIPKKKLVVLTGVSGSGKILAGLRHALRRGPAPLRRVAVRLRAPVPRARWRSRSTTRSAASSPTISIEQKTTGTNPRSTVGTITEIADYLRVLYARVGIQHCHRCGKPVQGQTAQQIARELLGRADGHEARAARAAAREPQGRAPRAARGGAARGLRAPARGRRDRASPRSSRRSTSAASTRVEAVVDRLVVKARASLARSPSRVETALRVGQGMLIAATPRRRATASSRRSMACADCGLSFPELTPQSFSFNSPQGMCVDCNGLGTRVEIDPDLVVPDAVALHRRGRRSSPGGRTSRRRPAGRTASAARSARSSASTWSGPGGGSRSASATGLLHGTGERALPGQVGGQIGPRDASTMTWEGVLPRLMRRFKETGSERAKRWYAQFLGDARCRACAGRAAARRERRGPGGRTHASSRSRRSPSTRRASSSRELELAGAAREIAAEVLQGDPRPPRRSSPRWASATCPSTAPGPSLSGGEVAAHPAGEPGGLRADRRDLHPRRALDRPAPARQPAPARRRSSGCATSATPWWWSSTTRRRSAAPTT